MSDDSRGASERVALVTGGSTGFGREIVLALAGRGAPVVAAFRGSRSGFEAAAADLQRRAGGAGGSLTCQPLDVTDDASVRSAVREVLDRHGRIDSLVNCAGIGLLGPMECTSIDQARAVFETNVLGTMRMVQAVVPAMRAQGRGTILNLGSDVGLHANFYQSAYAASKFAVHGLSQVMRWELQTFGIRVAVIDPGWYTTEFGESIVSVFGCPGVATHYEAQVAAWDAAVERVEVPNRHPEEVARLVVDVLEQPAPRFLNPVGWDPVRMAGVNLDELDEYEARLFDHYGMAAFRGPGGERDA
jgi:NAD(P)-dependent dehydrogenase (short-subunit alcohol dehydrogenase family)